MSDAPRNWKEAKALGWSRCCAYLSTGRCRKRATVKDDKTPLMMWCKRHSNIPAIAREISTAGLDSLKED